MTDLLTILAQATEAVGETMDFECNAEAVIHFQAAEAVGESPIPSILIMLIPLAVMVLIVIAFGLTRFLITRHRINKHSTNLEEMLNSNTDNRKEK